jgi:hypothetical protein
MSGYLQRIASNVLHPARAIHPVVGSRWSAPRREDSPEIILNETVTPAGPPRVANPSEDMAQKHERTRPESISSLVTRTLTSSAIQPKISKSTEAASELKKGSESTAEFQPLMAAQQPEEIAHGGLRDAPAKNHPRDLEELHETSTAPVVDDAALTFTPLIQAASYSQPPFDAIRAVHPMANADRARSARQQTLTQTLHEPDEIQIHIGRIEVTAALPPPARPAVKPARKSLDLGEYLKRDRRAR